MGWLGSRRRNARHDTAAHPCSRLTVAGGGIFLVARLFRGLKTLGHITGMGRPQVARARPRQATPWRLAISASVSRTSSTV